MKIVMQNGVLKAAPSMLEKIIDYISEKTIYLFQGTKAKVASYPLMNRIADTYELKAKDRRQMFTEIGAKLDTLTKRMGSNRENWMMRYPNLLKNISPHMN